MRLSEIVAKRGIDAFRFDDFLFVGKQLSQDPSRLILVGGQAIETWGHVFHVLPPTGDHAPLTEDTDFFGSKKDAQWLCNLLGKDSTELILAKDFDPSANTAMAYILTSDGRILLIDFLKTLIGLDNEIIKATAVPIDVAGVRLNVLHPLLCLKSRLSNLEHLSVKRNTNGVMQAHWSIDIVGAWLRRLVKEKATQKDLIKACHGVVEAAEYKSGPHCYREYGIDPLRAVGDEVIAAIGGRFVTEDWPRRTTRVAIKRVAMMTRYSFNAMDRRSAISADNLKLAAFDSEGGKVSTYPTANQNDPAGSASDPTKR